MSNLTYDDLPNQAKTWNMPLPRLGASGAFQHQVGFEITNIKKVLQEFCDSHQANGRHCTIGLFLYFYDEGGNFLNLIKDIQIKKLNVCFNSGLDSESNSNKHWLTRLESQDGVLELKEVNSNDTPDADPVKARGWRIKHFEGETSNVFSEQSDTAPTLVLEDAKEYGIQTIRGYRESLRIAYLDYGTLMHLFLAYRMGQGADEIDKSQLKFIFTGAEINHGEMIDPFFQKERADSHSDGILDPSVTPTLKMEGIYHKAGNQYISSDGHPFHTSSAPNISLPGVRVLPPCRRYWQVVEQVLNSASCQADFSLDRDFQERQAGVQVLSSKHLTENNLERVIGNVFFKPKKDSV